MEFHLTQGKQFACVFIFRVFILVILGAITAYRRKANLFVFTEIKLFVHIGRASYNFENITNEFGRITSLAISSPQNGSLRLSLYARKKEVIIIDSFWLNRHFVNLSKLSFGISVFHFSFGGGEKSKS